MTALVPVRKLHDDGYITVRYLMPDGAEPVDGIPEELTLGAVLHPITAVWDKRYRLGIWEDYYLTSTVCANLTYLSDSNPLLFEQVLDFLESAPAEQQCIMAHRITHTPTYPTETRPDAKYHGMYRTLLSSSWLLVELSADGIVGMSRQFANRLLGDTRKCVGDFEHPHFEAAAIATWIMQRHSDKRVKLTYSEHAEDIAFIDSRLNDVLSVRNELVRLGSIKKSDIESVLATPTVLRVGTL